MGAITGAGWSEQHLLPAVRQQTASSRPSLRSVTRLLNQPGLRNTKSALLEAELRALAKKIRVEFPEERSLSGRVQALANRVAPNFDPMEADLSVQSLDYLAVELGYGYKTANLMILRAHRNVISGSLLHLSVDVPPFMGICSEEMKGILKHLCGDDLFAGWEKFQRLRNPLDKKGLAYLEGLREKITKGFDGCAWKHAQLSEWLEASNAQFLIIRSSGKEDSDDCSNAGGNLSIPLVEHGPRTIVSMIGRAIGYYLGAPPIPPRIASSIGKVIASYFSEQSIRQRLALDDQSIRTQPPFLPVLIQEMVVDTVKAPLACGVMLTRDPNGAAEVTVVQAARGLNEGVVTGTVPVDTYLIDQQVNRIIRYKNTIAAPVLFRGNVWETSVVEQSRHDPEAPVFSDFIARDLKRAADALKELYARDKMDVEFGVTSGDSPTLVLFQARPLVEKVGAKRKRSYVRLPEQKEAKQVICIRGNTLLDGGGTVRKVTSPNAVLFVDSIEAALSVVLKRKNENPVDGIVVSRTESLTSHPAVMLRALGVPVLVISNPEAFSQAASLLRKASLSNRILFCPQRGIVTAEKDGLVRQGSVSYPIPRELSLNPVQSLSSIQQRYIELISSLNPAGIKIEGEITTLMEKIAEGSREQARICIA